MPVAAGGLAVAVPWDCGQCGHHWEPLAVHQQRVRCPACRHQQRIRVPGDTRGGPVTRRQLTAVMLEFERLRLGAAADRPRRLELLARLAGRDTVSSTRDLTMGEAGRCLRYLRTFADRGELEAWQPPPHLAVLIWQSAAHAVADMAARIMGSWRP